MKRKTLTILFADVQGYTARTSRQTRQENELFVKEVKSFVEKHVRDKGGSFVKAMGDGFLATFDSPTDAVACGKDMQQQIEQRNANILNQDNFIRFRIGISTGEVTIDENSDVYGEAVNIAARIQKFADPNDVYISEATYLAMNKSEIQAVDLGPQRFKNVIQEIRVYKIFKKASESAELIRNRFRINKTFLISAIGSAVILVLLLFLFFNKKKPVIPDREFPQRHIYNEHPGKEFQNRAFFKEPKPDIKRLMMEGNYTEENEYERENAERIIRHPTANRIPQEDGFKENSLHRQKPDIRDLMQEKNYAMVIQEAERQLEKNPDNVMLHEIASEAYLRLQNYQQAKIHLKQALDIMPENNNLYYKMALLLEQTGEYENAIHLLWEYVRKEPNERERDKALRKIQEIETRQR